MRKHGLTAFSLCVTVALGLRLSLPRRLKVNRPPRGGVSGAQISTTLLPEVKGALETDASLLTSTGKSNVPVTVLCQKLEVREGLLHAEGKDSGILSFTECETFIEGALSKVCKPVEPIVAETLSLLVLHEGRDLDKFFPHEGKNFTNIHFSELCTLEVNEGAGVPITGSIFAKDCQGEMLTEKVTHLIEEDAAATAALGGLFFGTHKATLDGSANLSLIGAHEGMTWSGHPA